MPSPRSKDNSGKLVPLSMFISFVLFSLEFYKAFQKCSSLPNLIVFKRTMGKVSFGAWVTQSFAPLAQKGDNWKETELPSFIPTGSQSLA